ncbi:MAG: AAA family ATPase [Anaerolineae bacterium]|nr:AAA family ATPase [Phycisphaerae bacterium]
MIGRVIVINGSVASGKSTLARLLATTLRVRGFSAGVIDTDLIYGMLGDNPKSDPHAWRLARHVTSSLAAAMIQTELRCVIVDGCYWSRADRMELSTALSIDTPTHFISLYVSYAEALRRAQGDPTRVLSKDPEFLRPHVASYIALLSEFRSTDLVVDTETATPDELVDRIATLVASGGLRTYRRIT